MNLRYLAILILLIPTARGVGWIVEQTAHQFGDSGCCQVVEPSSCCEVVKVERSCEISDGACVCVSDSSDFPEPISVPMIPLTLGQLMLAIPETGELIVWSLPEFDGRPALDFRTQEIRIVSNNQAQSLLGNWRM